MITVEPLFFLQSKEEVKQRKLRETPEPSLWAAAKSLQIFAWEIHTEKGI